MKKEERTNYIIDLNEHKFIIKQEKEYFVVYSTTDFVYPWLDKLNCQSMLKKFDHKLLELHINNRFSCDKLSLSLPKPNNLSKPIKYDLNVMCIKETKKIREYIDQSIKNTPFSKDLPAAVRDNYSSSLKIFNRTQCADIIITDYIKLFRWLNKSNPKTHNVLGLAANSKEFEGNKNSINILNKTIYDWRIKIDCDDQNLPKEWNYVLIDIKLHPDMYPNYPPTVNIVHPKFKNDLNMRISRSKFTMLDYWNCDLTPVDIIVRILSILKKFGEIDYVYQNKSYSNLSKTTQTLLSEISSHLESLSMCMDLPNDDDIDKDQKFVKISDIVSSNMNDNKKSRELIDSGTGYGHSSAHRWDINEYHNLIRERNNKFTVFINSMIIKINRIYDFEKNDMSCVIDLIKESQLYKFIVKIFKNVSILEIQNEHKYYRSIFDLIHIFCLEYTIRLFYDPDPDKALYNAICNLKQRSQTSLDLDESNENANMIQIIHSMIDEPYKKYLDKIKSNNVINVININNIGNVNNINNVNNVKSSVKCQTIIYNDTMSQYRYKIDNGLCTDESYQFRNKVHDEDIVVMKQCYKRLSSEIPSLIESMSVSENALVIGLIDKKRPNCIRFMLNGPHDTPYAKGLFIFDTYCGSDYPSSAPEFRLMNTKGYHFNPNLYPDGKVCLSLLNTYSGSTPHESEKWNPKLSTLSQIIISIQANIFVDHPYFNTQGYEKYRGTQKGDIETKKYNEQIRYYTMHVCMLNLLKSVDIYANLKNAIITHYYLQQDKIVEQCQMWINECQNEAIKNNMQQTFIELKNEFTKLTLPVKS